MGRRKTRTDALRGDLLAVAARLLAAGGAGAVTTRAVAAGAGASLAAVNELFGGKAGLARALFAAGFARLAADLRALEPTGDPEADVLELALAVRSFARREPHLHEVMFSRPFAEFRPEQADARAAEDIYAIVVGRVAAVLGPDRAEGAAKDSAVGLFATVQGLLSLEASGLLGGTPETAERRFRLTVTAALRGLSDADRSPQEAR
ncbi:TetR-like C-terminal domain-containing protein [Actinomadura sp. NTSP31]|uniref:TetR-like C-terminal domain-containing protein n=1 Tax=Actinomadura sp. NTSP31 TaxID=1735447 RepID=UPI0035C243A4